jgi:hypothetical protein
MKPYRIPNGPTKYVPICMCINYVQVHHVGPPLSVTSMVAAVRVTMIGSMPRQSWSEARTTPPLQPQHAPPCPAIDKALSSVPWARQGRWGALLADTYSGNNGVAFIYLDRGYANTDIVVLCR